MEKIIFLAEYSPMIKNEISFILFVCLTYFIPNSKNYLREKISGELLNYCHVFCIQNYGKLDLIYRIGQFTGSFFTLTRLMICIYFRICMYFYTLYY